MTAARCSTTREIYCEISQQVFNIWLQPDNAKVDRAASSDFPFKNRSANAASCSTHCYVAVFIRHADMIVQFSDSLGRSEELSQEFELRYTIIRMDALACNLQSPKCE